MRFARALLAAARFGMLAVALTACSTNIGELNMRPDKYYQDKVAVKGQITRSQTVGSDTLIEIADLRESRILVRLNGPLTNQIGDWIKVTGVLVPEARVGDQVLYDVLVAEDISDSGPPLLERIM